MIGTLRGRRGSLISGLVQEIPVHGAESPEKNRRLERQNARHTEDPGHRALSEDEGRM
jgi:hypothetical protein